MNIKFIEHVAAAKKQIENRWPNAVCGLKAHNYLVVTMSSYQKISNFNGATTQEVVVTLWLNQSTNRWQSFNNDIEKNACAITVIEDTLRRKAANANSYLAALKTCLD